MYKACNIAEFTCYEETVPGLLDEIGAAGILSEQPCILLKPNLVNLSPPPVTFPVDAARAIIQYVQDNSSARVIIAEGTGEPDISTGDVFRAHGYTELAQETGAQLIDLNEAELVELSNPECRVFPKFMMPKVVMDSFVISAATLKAHSLARVTLSMKNMVGIAPPAHYQRGGYWRKSAFHEQMQSSIFDLNRYRKPDLAFIDGSVGLAEHHLGGPACNPPVGKLLAGFDPVRVDACGSELLGIPWHQVGHIKMADKIIGLAK